MPAGLSQPHPSFPWTLIQGVKSQSHEGGSDKVPSRLGSQHGPRKRPLSPGALKSNALLGPMPVVPGALKPSPGWTASIPSTPFSLPSQDQQGKCSNLKARFQGFPFSEWFSKDSCLILWVSFPLYLSGSDETEPLTNLGITAQSLAWLMLAAETGGTQIGWLAVEELRD